MIDFENNIVIGTTIGDTWRQALWLCYKNGFEYKIGSAKNGQEYGSYIGQKRIQLPFFMGRVKMPWVRPLSPILPPNYPPPTDDDKIVGYFAEYLMNPVLKPNELYRYSSWVAPQVETMIKHLVDSNGKTNQATISVGDTSCADMQDPPCLRLISFKTIDGTLRTSVFFRSWDLVAGFPENLGGIQLLKEYVLEFVNDALKEKGVEPLQDGELVTYSDGLHIYDHYIDVIKALMPEGMDS